jgi:NOL1/NOP2/fmu family ribosome biogenesis protein
MQKLDILNKKEISEINSYVESQWGTSMPDGYAFLRNRDGRTYMVNREAIAIADSKVRIDSIGLYIGTIEDREFRLSIEGSQLIGGSANKNILELNDSQRAKYIKGEDMEIDHDDTGFMIIKHRNDYYGTGKIRKKRLMNFFPKSRRLTSLASGNESD